MRALAQLSLSLMPGEVHALVGENGSGKSTLVGILSGTVVPDEGTVTVRGDAVDRYAPRHARSHGIYTVFQDGSLIPDLTIAQNLYIGTDADKRPPYGRLEQWAGGVLHDHGLGAISPNARTRTVAPGDRQLIEVSRALHNRPGVLLLDEATSALDAAGVDRVLALMERAASGGDCRAAVRHPSTVGGLPRRRPHHRAP